MEIFAGQKFTKPLYYRQFFANAVISSTQSLTEDKKLQFHQREQVEKLANYFLWCNKNFMYNIVDTNPTHTAG